jgi:cytochrome c2
MKNRLMFTFALLCTAALLFSALTFSFAAAKKKVVKHAKPAASAALIKEGEKEYASLKCDMCHMINKKGTKIGPELTHIGKTWTEAKMEMVIRNPRKLSPKGMMPAYPPSKVNAKQLKALVTYLVSLK